MNILIQLLIAMTLGLCSYYLVVFIDFCMNDKNIFDWYYLWLLKSVEPKSPKLAKVIGMCAACFGFWVASFLFILYAYKLNIGLVYYIPYIAVCEYYLIKKFTS